ncbi:TPA: hypothetical protein DEP21_02370 [Patescibacteria group bacterium]|nr:hypothetical protein [Candidatus Gracilibacteria bacterium]
MAFILATTEVHKVPDTIVSRCQVFNFRKVPDSEMVSRLEDICKSENLAYDPAALGIIAKISEGCVRDAVKYIDQVSILGEVNEAHVTKFLGVASESGIKDFLGHIKNKDREQLFAAITTLVQQGVDLQNFAKQVLMYLDAHLFEDMDFLIYVSHAFTEILNNLRYYPYPAIAYKVVLHKYTGETAAVTVSAPVAAPVAPVVTPAPAAAPVTPPVSAPIASGNNDNTSLWEQVLSRIDRESLQKSLKDHSTVSKIEENTVFVTVINKFTQAALEKQENKAYIE